MRTTLILKGALATSALLAAAHAFAWECEYEKELDVTLNLDGSEQLAIVAMAGDLEILGQPGATEARAIGRVCSSRSEWLDEAAILTEGGRNAEIRVSLPDTDNTWNALGQTYVFMDLRVEVPDNVALDVRDSSGELEIDGTASVEVHDSSGDIDIRNVTGDVWLSDSSGAIEAVDINGNVTVRQDSSGDIDGRGIQGTVLVEKDSSGDIRFRNVRDDYIVERDSSGDIEADSVGGDFRVMRDGSGSVDAHAVSGDVDIPRKG